MKHPQNVRIVKRGRTLRKTGNFFLSKTA